MVAQYGTEKHLLGVSSSSINHLAKLGNTSSQIKDLSLSKVEVEED